MAKIKFNRKIRDGLIIAFSVIVVAITAVMYAVFTNRHIFEESSDHLGEVYAQVKNVFKEKVDTNRSLLNSWKTYIDGIIDDVNDGDADKGSARRKELVDFIALQKELWGFSDFYFIGEETTIDDGSSSAPYYNNLLSCKMIDGEPINMRIRRKFDEVLKDEQCAVVGFMENDAIDTPHFMLFSVAVPPNTFDGFNYRAIGLQFDSDNLTDILDVSTFGTDGLCYVVLPDGNILLQLDHGKVRDTNLLDFLRSSHSDLSAAAVEQIKNDWTAKPQKSGTRLVNMNDVEYYFTYLPVDFVDWMLIGVAPSGLVNSSMDWFRTVTLVVMILIFVVMCTGIIAMVVLNNKRMVKETMLEVRSRENLLDLLSLNNNDMFVMFSPETFKAEYISANLETVLGIDLQTAANDVHTILPSSDDWTPLTTESIRALPDGNTWDKAIKLENAKTGETYWFRMALYHVNSGDVEKCVLTFSDRTKDKKMREQLESALELAKQANEAKSNFLSNMSHDIRTPMNAIIGYATLLERDADNPARVRDYTRKITYSGQHLLSLINDILDMSKIESGKTSLYIEQFCLPEFIEELYSMTISQVNAKKQTFDVLARGNLPEYVYGDKMRLNQIMLNILSNAIKYTEPGGDIQLIVETMPQTVHNHAHLLFTVKDTGIGMSADYVKKIFEPFSRETNSRTKRIQGTGLGMAITKNIVNLMGGIITVESEPGKGTKFTVELELAIAAGEQEDEDFWRAHGITHILVVDDKEDVCMDIKELMSDTDVRVDYALNGLDAIKMIGQAVADKDDYSLVLLDWKMPDMDGVETARRIREEKVRDIPIIVLTSYSYEDIEEEARAAGIDLFLSKPFFVSNFRRAVAQIATDGKAADAEPAPEQENTVLDGLHILAAEDNEINVEILTELLEIEGAVCDVAFNGKEALEKFESSEPGQYDIIFMDVQMPVMDGYEATRAIRRSKHKDAKTIPIMAMTANAFDDDVQAALESGMNAHLAKPIDMNKLKELVSKLLGR